MVKHLSTLAHLRPARLSLRNPSDSRDLFFSRKPTSHAGACGRGGRLRSGGEPADSSPLSGASRGGSWQSSSKPSSLVAQHSAAGHLRTVDRDTRFPTSSIAPHARSSPPPPFSNLLLPPFSLLPSPPLPPSLHPSSLERGARSSFSTRRSDRWSPALDTRGTASMDSRARAS